jgi:D-alanine-D-alanine ligase
VIKTIRAGDQELIGQQIQTLRRWQPAGRLQGMLDYLRKPYSCSGVAASAIAADKMLCKLIMAGLMVPTPRWRLPGEASADFLSQTGVVMIKPRMGGSSVGMKLVRHEAELEKAIRNAADTDSMEPLIEEFVPGLAVTVALLELPAGVLVLPPLATEPQSSDFYDAESKLDACSENLVTYGEAELPAQVIQQLREQSLKLWHGIGCTGMARIDFIAADSGVFALEVNTVPGLSYGSNFIAAANLARLSYGDVLLALLHEALNRKQDDVPLPVLNYGDLHA